MNADKELEMKNVQGEAPEEPAVKLNSEERTNESNTNENPLQVLSRNEAFLVPEFLDTAQAKEKIIVPVSNTLHMSTEELDALQQDSEKPKFSEKTIRPKLGDSPKSSANNSHSKQSAVSKTSAKTPNSKQGTVSKTTGHHIQTKHSNIPKTLSKTTLAKRGNIHKSAASIIHSKEASRLKSPEDTVQSKENESAKPSENIIQSKASDTHKTSKDTIQSEEGDNNGASNDTSKSQRGGIAKSPEDTTQSQEGNIQPMEGNLPKSSEETTQPKKSNASQLEEEIESLEPGLVNVITDKENFEEMLKEAGERMVAVEFSATWCGPCRVIKPTFRSLSLKYKDVLFLEVDADACEDLVQDCDVFCLPTFQFYRKKKRWVNFLVPLWKNLNQALKN